MLGSESITINSLPVVNNVGGVVRIVPWCRYACTLSSSDAGVNYQLKVGGVSTGGLVAGIGTMLISERRQRRLVYSCCY